MNGASVFSQGYCHFADVSQKEIVMDILIRKEDKGEAGEFWVELGGDFV